MQSQFINLSEITLPYTSFNSVKILLELDKPLRKLQLNFLTYMNQLESDAFGELLAKHAKTLESLEFKVPSKMSNHFGEDEISPVFLRFPAFPKLELLNITWECLDGSFKSIQTSPRNHSNNWQDISWIFPSGGCSMNYKSDLPCMECLILWPTYVQQSEGEMPRILQNVFSGHIPRRWRCHGNLQKFTAFKEP